MKKSDNYLQKEVIKKVVDTQSEIISVQTDVVNSLALIKENQEDIKRKNLDLCKEIKLVKKIQSENLRIIEYITIIIGGLLGWFVIGPILEFVINLFWGLPKTDQINHLFNLIAAIISGIFVKIIKS